MMETKHGESESDIETDDYLEEVDNDGAVFSDYEHPSEADADNSFPDLSMFTKRRSIPSTKSRKGVRSSEHLSSRTPFREKSNSLTSSPHSSSVNISNSSTYTVTPTLPGNKKKVARKTLKVPLPQTVRRTMPQSSHSTSTTSHGQSLVATPQSSSQSLNLSNSHSSAEENSDAVEVKSKLVEISNILGVVVKRLSKIEDKVMNSTSSSDSSGKRKVPQEVRSEVRMTYKALFDSVDDFLGFDTSSNVNFKDASNQEVVGLLVHEVKANNPAFATSDIRAAVYTYYKTLTQEATLKRNGKYEERKIARRRRERVVRRLTERSGQFKRMSYSSNDKAKWEKVLISSMISSDESDFDDGQTPVLMVKELPWRSKKVTNFFIKLDQAHCQRMSEQAARQTKPRLRKGRISKRPLPNNCPQWAISSN